MDVNPSHRPDDTGAPLVTHGAFSGGEEDRIRSVIEVFEGVGRWRRPGCGAPA